MNDEPTPPTTPEPKNKLRPRWVFLWLVAAFLPSVAAMIALKNFQGVVSIYVYLMVFNFVCSGVAGGALVQNIRSDGTRLFAGILLMIILFIVNAAISVSMGCGALG